MINFQSVIGLSEYFGLEYLDNSVTRQEVAFWRTLLLGNNRNYVKWDWHQITFAQPRLFNHDYPLEVNRLSSHSSDIYLEKMENNFTFYLKNSLQTIHFHI